LKQNGFAAGVSGTVEAVPEKTTTDWEIILSITVDGDDSFAVRQPLQNSFDDQNGTFFQRILLSQ
jgi:hypothetical protein